MGHNGKRMETQEVDGAEGFVGLKNVVGQEEEAACRECAGRNGDEQWKALLLQVDGDEEKKTFFVATYGGKQDCGLWKAQVSVIGSVWMELHEGWSNEEAIDRVLQVAAKGYEPKKKI